MATNVDQDKKQQISSTDTENEPTNPSKMVTISVQVAQISTTAAEAINIQKGSVIEVDPLSNNSEVKIICNGKEIGSGEVTRIGNMWGIRVRQIF